MSAQDLTSSIGELIDKLSVENIKIYHARERILLERRSGTPDAKRIMDWEWAVSSGGERRVLLRDEINRRLDEAIRRGGFATSREVRTYEL